jgi:hypothetical protein
VGSRDGHFHFFLLITELNESVNKNWVFCASFKKWLKEPRTSGSCL